MTNFANPITDKSLIDELTKSPYQGPVESGYLPVLEAYEVKTSSDTSSVGSSKQKPTQSSGKTNKNNGSSNYVDNTDANRSSGKVGLGQYSDRMQDQLFKGFNEKDLTDGLGEDGFATLNRKKLEAMFKMLRGLANLNLILAQSLDSKEDIARELYEAYGGVVLEDGSDKNTWTEGAAKANKQMMGNLQKGIMAVMKKVDDQNKKYFNKKKAEYEAWREDTGKEIENTITCSSLDEEEYENMRALSNEFKAAKKKNIETLKQLSGIVQGATSKLNKIGESVFGDTFDHDDNTVYTDNGYIDMNHSARWFTEIRKILTGFVNANRIHVQALSMREEAYGSLKEGQDGKRSSNKFKAVEEVVESESSNLMGLFDGVRADVLTSQKMFNTAKYYDLQIEKLDESFLANLFSNITALLAAIAACIPGWGTLVAVGLGALSAGLGYLASQQADGVNDTYDPKVKEDKSGVSESANKSLGGVLDGMGKNVQSQVNKGLFDMTEDGFFQIDSGESANLQRQLNSINSGLLLIEKSRSERSKSLRAISRATSGLSGASDSDELISSACEAVLAQNNAQFGSLLFQLAEYKQGFNIERQQQIMMEDALPTFLISLGGSVVGGVGGVVGGGAGAALQLGANFGAALGNYFVATGNDSYGISEYNPDLSNFKSVIKENGKTSDKIANKLTEMEYEIYNELIENGICDIGDGKFGLNADLIAGLQKKFMGILNTLSVIVSSRETKAEVVDAIANGYGDSTLAKGGKMGNINKQFAAMFKTFSALKQVLRGKVEVLNRIAAAEDRVSSATIKLAVTGSICGATAIAVIWTALSLGMQFIGLVLYVGNAANTLFNYVYDIARSAIKSKADYGMLENYAARDSQKTKKDVFNKLNKATSLGSRLDQMEASLYLDGSLIEDAAYGSLGINTGALTKAQAEATGVYQTKEIIAGAIRQIQTCQTVLGNAYEQTKPIGSSGLTALSIANYQAKAITEAVLQTQMEALQTIVGRHKEMSAHLRSAIMSSVKLGLYVIGEVAKFAFKGDIFSNAKLGQLEAKQAAGTLGGKEAAELKDLKLGQAKSSKLEIAFTVCMKLLDISMEWAVGAMIDKANDSDSKEARDAEISKEEKSLSQSSKGEKSFGQKLDTMGAQSLSDNMSAGAYSIESQDINTKSINAKEGLSAFKGLPKAAADMYRFMKGLKQLDKEAKLLKMRSEIEQKISQKRREYEGVVQQYNKLNAEQSHALAKFQPTEQSSQTNQALLQYADQILANIEQMVQFEKLISEARLAREENVEHKTKPLQTKENKKTPQIEKPDKQNYSAKEIKQKVADIKDTIAEIRKDPKSEKSAKMMQQLDAKIQDITNSVSNSNMWAQFSEAMQMSPVVDKIQAKENKNLAQIVEKKKGKKVKLESLKSHELKDLYHQYHSEVFKPTSKALQQVKAKRVELMNKLNKATTEDEKINLGNELSDLQSAGKEGVLRQNIQGYNRLVGQINNAYKKALKREGKPVKDLEPISQKDKAVPAAGAPAAAAKADAANQPLVQEQPKTPSNAQALNARADQIAAKGQLQNNESQPAPSKPAEKPINIAIILAELHRLSLMLDVAQETIDEVKDFAKAHKGKADGLLTDAKKLEEEIKQFKKAKAEVDNLVKGIEKYKGKKDGNAAKLMNELLAKKVQKLNELKAKLDTAQIETVRKGLETRLIGLEDKIKLSEELKKKEKASVNKDKQIKAVKKEEKKVPEKQPNEAKKEVIVPMPKVKVEPKKVSHRKQAEEASRAQQQLASLAVGRSYGSI